MGLSKPSIDPGWPHYSETLCSAFRQHRLWIRIFGDQFMPWLQLANTTVIRWDYLQIVVPESICKKAQTLDSKICVGKKLCLPATRVDSGFPQIDIDDKLQPIATLTAKFIAKSTPSILVAFHIKMKWMPQRWSSSHQSQSPSLDKAIANTIKTLRHAWAFYWF